MKQVYWGISRTIFLIIGVFVCFFFFLLFLFFFCCFFFWCLVCCFFLKYSELHRTCNGHLVFACFSTGKKIHLFLSPLFTSMSDGRTEVTPLFCI